MYLSVISFVFIFYETHRDSQISRLMNSYELLCLPILYLPHYLLFLIHGFQSYFSFFRSYCGLLQFHSFCSLDPALLEQHSGPVGALPHLSSSLLLEGSLCSLPRVSAGWEPGTCWLKVFDQGER